MVAIVEYRRVSDKKQGQSGLGLEAQQTAVQSYASAVSGRVIATYTEVEHGDDCDRPEINKAIAHAKRAKATLVVAKLDRLARDVEFTAKLMNSGIDFIACDNPNANRLTIHILAAVAENELRCIRERTRNALQAAKARGVLLGSARPGQWDGREEQRLAGAKKGNAVAVKVLKEQAEEAYADILPTMQGLRSEGRSLQEIANKLTADGHTTRRGRPWNKMQVKLVLDRAS